MLFVFGIDTARIDSQTANPFLYDSFDLPNNANMARCYLEVEMETNTPIFTSNHVQIFQEFSEVYYLTFTPTMIIKVEHYLTEVILSLYSHLFILN